MVRDNFTHIQWQRDQHPLLSIILYTSEKSSSVMSVLCTSRMLNSVRMNIKSTSSRSSAVRFIPASNFHIGWAKCKSKGRLVRMATPKSTPRNFKCFKSFTLVHAGLKTYLSVLKPVLLLALGAWMRRCTVPFSISWVDGRSKRENRCTCNMRAKRKISP